MAVKSARARAVFLDKDGTLIKDVPYNVDPARMELLPGAVVGLRRLHAAGYRLLVVTNQSGVARGYFAEEALAAVRRRLGELFTGAGVPPPEFYYCPHHPNGIVARYAVTCPCRKPLPGLLHRAAEEHGLDLRRSWLVGDILDDIEAGHRAGCRTILLDNGHETEWLWSPWRMPDYRTADLTESAAVIVAADLHTERNVHERDTSPAV